MKTKIGNTIEYLRKCRAAKDAGYPVSFTTDPDWLMDMAINRRAGWPDDPTHSRGSCMPIAGRYPRKATGIIYHDAERTARAVNTPRLIVRWAPAHLQKLLAHRLYTED